MQFSNTPSPLVSIVMPIYNGERYMRKAIESILAQTYTQWECIIIDDCSTDNTATILMSYKDERIRVITQKENQGVGAALALGVEAAKGAYIARMDGDDIALPERLAKQVAFMEAHPEYGVIGSHYRLIGEENEKGRPVMIPVIDEAIKFRMLITFPFCHPTMMFRASLLHDNKLNYDPSYPIAEDYVLLIELYDKTHFYNMPESLLKYRKHSGSVTTLKKAKNADAKWAIVAAYHKQVLSEAFRERTDYELIRQAYFSQEWHSISGTIPAFATLLYDMAEDYCQTIDAHNRLAIRGHAAELLWRAILFKTGTIKRPALLLKLALSKYGMVFPLLYHAIRQIKLRLMR